MADASGYTSLDVVRGQELLHEQEYDDHAELDYEDGQEDEEPRTCGGRVKSWLDNPRKSCVGQVVQTAIFGMIIFSTCCVIAETVPELEVFNQEFSIIEEFTTVLFTAEFIARLLTADSFCAHILTMQSAIDVAAILPWYIEQLVAILYPTDTSNVNDVAASFKTLRIVRMIQFIRLLRVLRLAKAAKHSDMISTVVECIRDSLQGFGVLVVFIMMGTIFSATIIFFLESEEPGTAFTSIPAALWWAMPTITGVGYGDMIPETIGGKIAGAVSMVGGILITGLSVAIISKSFVDSFDTKFAAKQDDTSPRGGRSRARTASVAGRDADTIDLSGTPLENLKKLEDALKHVLLTVGPPTKKQNRTHDGVQVLDLFDSNWRILREQNEKWFEQVRTFAKEVNKIRWEEKKNGSKSLPVSGSLRRQRS